MKKIYLAVALSVFSAFSTSAQTTEKLSLNEAPVKTAGAVEAIKTADQKSDDKIAEEKKPLAVETEEKKPAASEAETKKPEVIVTDIKTPEVGKEVKTPVQSNQPEASKKVFEAEKKPELTAAAVKKVSLGGLSTGNTMIDGYIEEFSELFNVDPLLIYAQMHQESSFNSRAVSTKGASGFMQLMPDTARRFSVTNVYNPKQNIKAGVKYMRWLLDKFGGDPRLALAGYNAGEGAVIKYGNKVPPYRETQNYVERIMNHYELISTQNSALAANESK